MSGMEETSPLTKQKIQAAALAEFLDKGFLGASLRQIVKNAGVTTGAFYGYFSSKEALFASIVEPHAAALMGRFMEAQTSFAELPETEQPGHIGQESADYVHWMVDYICQNHEPVKLLLQRPRAPVTSICPQHGGGGGRVHPPLYGGAAPAGAKRPRAEPVPLPYHRQRMFNGLFEIVVHDMPREQAMRTWTSSGLLHLRVAGPDAKRTGRPGPEPQKEGRNSPSLFGIKVSYF